MNLVPISVAAARRGCSVQAVYQRIRRGRLSSFGGVAGSVEACVDLDAVLNSVGASSSRQSFVPPVSPSSPFTGFEPLNVRSFSSSVSVLFVRSDSVYKKLGADIYDVSRNALTFHGGSPVVAHPPCRSWGSLSHMAKPRVGEKDLALWALLQVRLCGGVLEHPAKSKLWKSASLPAAGESADVFGGYTLLIDQYWFGHVANKPTHLYICGVGRDLLPPIPFKAGEAVKTITGVVGSPGRRCTQYEREYTPPRLAAWLLTVASMCRKSWGGVK
jgi:hypothetical protein